ncbi:uncharacterized protein DS421_13g439080 [Arachis hypogaea]|nr:uncharacterized protein DS421_13g439080 [Arachis hypogaea]
MKPSSWFSLLPQCVSEKRRRRLRERWNNENHVQGWLRPATVEVTRSLCNDSEAFLSVGGRGGNRPGGLSGACSLAVRGLQPSLCLA